MDGTKKLHTDRLERSNLSSVHMKNDPPEWTNLELCKCPNCPLGEAMNPHCAADVKFIPLEE